MTSNEREATIKEVLAGDAARFTDIVRDFDAPVRRIVGGRMADPGALEEVVQEVWCRVYRQLSKLADITRFEAWLGRIVEHSVTDHFRERRRRERFASLDDALLAEPGAVTVDRTWVWDVVSTLQPEFRDVLVWRYREHSSYAQIARLIGAPTSTVRGRLYQARLALRRALENEDMQC